MIGERFRNGWNRVTARGNHAAALGRHAGQKGDSAVFTTERILTHSAPLSQASASYFGVRMKAGRLWESSAEICAICGWFHCPSIRIDDALP